MIDKNYRMNSDESLTLSWIIQFKKIIIGLGIKTNEYAIRKLLISSSKIDKIGGKDLFYNDNNITKIIIHKSACLDPKN